MDIGIYLPTATRGVTGEDIVTWVRRIEEGPFSSIGVADRVTYSNYEPLVTLGAAAAITHRVRLVTGVLIGPVRNAGILAKQAATIDALSGGRLSLGLGVGAREDDYEAAPAQFKRRGARFEEQLNLMKLIWAGLPAGGGVGPVGPEPIQEGGPEILIGATTSRKAVERVAKWCDGYFGGGTPKLSERAYRIAEHAWKEAGRPGGPRFVCGAYFALGPGVQHEAESFIRAYYDHLGPILDNVVETVLMSPQQVREAVKAFADIGVDELLLSPCVPDIAELDRLQDALG